MITAGEGTQLGSQRKVANGGSLQSKVSNLANHTRVSGPIRQLKSYSVSKYVHKKMFFLRMLVQKHLIMAQTKALRLTDCREVQQLNGFLQSEVCPRAHIASICK